MRHQAYIALGSNIDFPLLQIERAVKALHLHAQIKVIKQTPCYQNPPIGFIEQPVFINAACLVETTLDPLALLDCLLAIELDMGRVRAFKNGPRNIDLDLILYGNQIMHHERLELPHPQMKHRDFVLWPLFVLNPDLILPDGVAIQSLIKKQPTSLIVVEKDLA